MKVKMEKPIEDSLMYAGNKLPVLDKKKESINPINFDTWNNTKPDKKEINNLQDIIEGSAVGTTAGAGLGILLGYGLLGAIIGGPAGLLIGAAIGKIAKELIYDFKYAGRWLKNAAKAFRGLASHSKNKIEDYFWPEHHLPPLTLKDLKGAKKCGNLNRQYDGYDSSRDIFAVYSREGNLNEKYTFQVEMANLRDGAEYFNLDTYILLNWKDKDNKGTKTLPFNLKSSQEIEPYKVAIKINRRHKSQIIDEAGKILNGKAENVTYSTTFSTVGFQLNKDIFKKMRWKDGDPFSIQVLTTNEKDLKVADRISAKTNNIEKPQEILKKADRWEGKFIYYIFTDRFNNGDKTNDQGTDLNNPEKFHGGDWQGIIDKLDYIKDLGAKCIWISCPYLQDKNFFGKDGYHAYWPHSFIRTEPHFGDLKKLQELVEKAHEKGMKVVLDVVINHTGYNHPFVTSPFFKDWFHKEGDIKRPGQYAMEKCALAGLPDLNQDNSKVSRYLIDAHKRLILKTGVDGFRVDAARHVPDEFLRNFDKEMHKTGKDFIEIGETFVPETNFLSRYQNETIDSVFDFTFSYFIRHIFAADKKRTLKDKWEIFKGCLFNNPFESIRALFSSRSGSMYWLSAWNKIDKYYDNPKKLAIHLDNHDMTRFMSDTGGDYRQLELALAFLFGTRGLPAVYYGSEVGMGANDDNKKEIEKKSFEWSKNRSDMEWGKNPDFTEQFKTLAKARNSSLALQFGTQKDLLATYDTYAFTRMRPEEEVICVFNNSENEKEIVVPLDKQSRIGKDETLKDLISNNTVKADNKKVVVKLPPKGYGYFQWKEKE